MSLIFTALLLILVSMIWVVRDRGGSTDTALTPPAPMLVQSVQAMPAALPAPAAAVAAPAVAADVTVTPPIPAEAMPAAKTAPLVHVATDGNVNYTARAGDTVSELATALRGSDSKTNRDAVIAGDAGLQNNPDRVLEGKTYSLPPAAQVEADAPAEADAATPDAAADATPAAAPAPAAQRDLKYIAQPGDNVAVLAASLLGGDTKANRDAVISGNASLVRDPNHLVAGKTYNIETTSGLAAAPTAAATGAAVVASPTSQPDADDAARMSQGRVLRYTAQSGDTVSKLATVLLGSDTKANRDAIISNNHSLQVDPDHLVAGQSYWISAPTASVAPDAATP